MDSQSPMNIWQFFQAVNHGSQRAQVKLCLKLRAFCQKKNAVFVGPFQSNPNPTNLLEFGMCVSWMSTWPPLFPQSQVLGIRIKEISLWSKHQTTLHRCWFVVDRAAVFRACQSYSTSQLLRSSLQRMSKRIQCEDSLAYISRNGFM